MWLLPLLRGEPADTHHDVNPPWPSTGPNHLPVPRRDQKHRGKRASRNMVPRSHGDTLRTSTVFSDSDQ